MSERTEAPLHDAGDLTEPRLVYRYAPLKAVLGMSFFLLLAVAAGIVGLLYAPPVALVALVLAVVLLWFLLRECTVHIWVDWPDLVYRYRSLFRSIDRVIPSWEISGISPEITSMWRGHISERLVLEAGKDRLVVTPFYSKSDPAIPVLMEAVQGLPSSREQAEYELELARRAAGGESGDTPEEGVLVRMIWGMLEISIECPRCDGPVVVNGPFTEFVCPSCEEKIEMTPDIWADLFEDLRDELAEDTDEGMGGRSAIWGTYNTALYYGRLAPYCTECKRDFDMERDHSGEGELTCPDCGAATPVQQPPEWFDRVFEGARLIVNARAGQSGEEIAQRDIGPVMFSCAKCGGSITVTGASRSVECDHCGGSAYLPDDLWNRFHPAPTKLRWFVGFEAEPPVEEDD